VIHFSEQYDTMTDQELISAYQANGDQSHVASLYGNYMELVKGLCMNYLKNAADSEDAVMEIYEILVNKLKTHQVEHFKSWLYILSKNHCLSKIRKDKKHKDWESKLALHTHSQDVFHPFEESMKEHLLDKLENCLEKLIDSQQTCITRFYIEKQSYKEISTSLSMSWNRVRSLIQNGRRNLKICIEDS